jgi:hypothetical protein
MKCKHASKAHVLLSSNKPLRLYDGHNGYKSGRARMR